MGGIHSSVALLGGIQQSSGQDLGGNSLSSIVRLSTHTCVPDYSSINTGNVPESSRMEFGGLRIELTCSIQKVIYSFFS